MYNAGQWEPRLWPWAQPDLNYAAPEYILSRSCDVSSDMFSLGVLIHSIYNKGRPPFDCDNNMTAFKRNVEQVRTHPKFLGTLLNFVKFICRPNQNIFTYFIILQSVSIKNRKVNTALCTASCSGSLLCLLITRDLIKEPIVINSEMVSSLEFIYILRASGSLLQYRLCSYCRLFWLL